MRKSSRVLAADLAMSEHAEAETIHYTVDVVLLTYGGEVLLIKRKHDPFKGQWAFPGGHVNKGESSRQAAVRELEEETGIRVPAHSALKQFGVFDEPDRDPRGRYVTVVYTAILPEAIPPTAGDDAKEARWCPVNAPEAMAFDHASILGRVARNRLEQQR